MIASGRITMAQVDLDYMTNVDPDKVQQPLEAAS
jgi:hypothetical protein